MLFSRDNLGVQLNIVSNLAGTRFDKEVKKVFENITNTQFALLTYLFDHRNEITTQNQLAAVMHTSHPTMRNVIKRMIEKDLLSTNQSASDKRKIEVHLTDTAIDLMTVKQSQIDELQRQNQAILTKGLSNQEVDTLNHLLDVVIENLKERE